MKCHNFIQHSLNTCRLNTSTCTCFISDIKRWNKLYSIYPKWSYKSKSLKVNLQIHPTVRWSYIVEIKVGLFLVPAVTVFAVIWNGSYNEKMSLTYIKQASSSSKPGIFANSNWQVLLVVIGEHFDYQLWTKEPEILTILTSNPLTFCSNSHRSMLSVFSSSSCCNSELAVLPATVNNLYKNEEPLKVPEPAFSEKLINVARHELLLSNKLLTQ